jgi:hypothetical protein
VFISRKNKRIRLEFCDQKIADKTRRKMNSFKKIAIGIAAALSISTLSAVPTNAAVNADTFVIDTASDAVLVGESATAVVTVGFLAQNTGDTVTVTSSMVSLPAGAAQLATLSVAETTSATVALGSGNYTADVASSSNSVAAVSAKLTVTLATPSVAGIYVVKLTPTLKGGGGIVNSAPVTWTVTVTAPDTKASAATSTSIINAGETSTATTDATVYASKALSADAAAVIVVTQKNAAGGSASESLTAIVSGPGTIGVGSNPTTLSAQGRALTVSAGQLIGVFSDGTAGVGTVTITTQSGVVLSTESVTFYGDIARIVAKSEKSVIATGSNADVVSAIAYDAQGVTVGSGTLYATSSDLTLVSNSATSATIVGGVAKFAATGVKTGIVNFTISNGATAPVVSNQVAVRVEGTASAVKIAFDKESYMPGEAATISVSVIDATGLPMSPKTYANLFTTGGITSSYAFGSGSADLTGVSVTTETSTVKTFKVFMPLNETDIKITAKGGTSLPVAGQVEVSATAKVVNTSSAAAREAAKAAEDAANDATVAALSAAKAAEAATAQAQAAVDAVAELSASVTKLISALRAQITALTNLVVKIQKKVKA